MERSKPHLLEHLHSSLCRAVTNPILALCLVVTQFPFARLPPLMEFFKKQMILTTILNNNKIILVLVGLLISVIIRC